MADPKVSVIVPVYNAEKYLNRCLYSILNQTYRNLEVLLVDDGSTDLSGKLCEQCAKEDSRVQVLHQKNSGAAAARNAGLSCATGDYIAFVDSDDFIELTMYEILLKTAVENNCDLVLCDCMKEADGHEELYTHNIRGGFYNKQQMYQEYFPQLLMTRSVNYPPTISNWVLFIRRSLIEDHHLRYLVGMAYSEDLMFGSQVAYYAERFYYLKNKSFYHYISNPDSVTHGAFQNRWPLLQALYQHISLFFRFVPDYDFNLQVDLCLLFFVYHAIGTIYGCNLPYAKKKSAIMEILKDQQVEQMLMGLSLKNLDLSIKQKVLTVFYRKKIGVNFLIRYFSGKK